jgi:hypothetical protein
MVTLPVRLLVWGLVRWAPWLLLLGWGGLVLAQGVAPLPARAVVNPTVAPAAVKLNVATKVRIYADIGDPNVIAAGVNLLQVGAAVTNPTIVGVLKDDGTGGDEIAGDGRLSNSRSTSGGQDPGVPDLGPVQARCCAR